MAIEVFDIPAHWYNKETDQVVTAETSPGQEVCSLVTPNLPAGRYNIYYSFQCEFSTRNRAAHFGLTGDKADAQEFAISASDNDELHKNRLYGYPFEWPGGVLTAGLNFHKDPLLITFTVEYVDVAISRVA